MANFLINSAGLVTTGTDVGEILLIQSGAVTASTVLAAAGNDTIQVLSGPASAGAVSLVGAGGADLFTVATTVLENNSTVRGGAGGDTITFGAAGGSRGVIALGDGSDALVATAAGADLRGTYTFGGGADVLTAADGLAQDGRDASYGMGAGKDTVTFTDGTFDSASFIGGGGADVINLSAAAGDADDVDVKGGAGGDTITFDLQDTDIALRGGNGSDLIQQSAGDSLGASAQLLGGAGADTITLAAAFGDADSNALVGGGAGKDSLNVAQAFLSGNDVSIMGGGGNDSISIGEGVTIGEAGTVFGGAGADSITFTGVAGTGVALNSTGFATEIGIRAFSDSTLTSMDVVTYEATAGIATGLNFTVATDGLGTDLVRASGFAVGTAAIDSAMATFTDVNDLTARIDLVDTMTVNSTGAVVVFSDSEGSAGYVFIQGGATDTVMKFNELGASIGAGFVTGVTVNNSSIDLEIMD